VTQRYPRSNVGGPPAAWLLHWRMWRLNGLFECSASPVCGMQIQIRSHLKTCWRFAGGKK